MRLHVSPHVVSQGKSPLADGADLVLGGNSMALKRALKGLEAGSPFPNNIHVLGEN